MKILQVVHDFLPKAIGGTQIYTYSLSKELSKQHEVYLFFKDTEVNENKFIKKGYFDGLPFLAINPNKCFRKFPYFDLIRPKNYFLSKNKKIDKIFKDLIEEFKPDIVHFQHLIGLSPNFVKIAHEKKIPVVFTVHDYWLLCPKAHLIDSNLKICNISTDKFKCIKCLWNDELYKFKKIKISQLKTYNEILKNTIKIMLNFLKRLYLIFYIFYIRPIAIREIIKKSDLFIAPSQRLKDELINSNIPGNKIVYIDLGINDGDLKNIQKTKCKQIRFAFIGSAMTYKGLDILIESFNDISNAFLDIYGFISEEDGKKYTKLIKNKNIRFKGVFKHDEACKIFSNVDILIVPSICLENSPLTIREAFASRTPVIASNIGGLPEMVQDGKTGLIFEMGNSRDLFNKLRYFIDSPSEIRRMSKEIRQIKTIKQHTTEINNIYENLLKKTKIK